MRKLSLIVVCLCLSACAGIRQNGDQFTAHAEAWNLLGLRIPSDDYKEAMKLVPPGSEIHTVSSTPSDWTSIVGGFTRLIWFSTTQVSGKLPKGS